MSGLEFVELSPMTPAACLPRRQIMEFAVRPALADAAQSLDTWEKDHRQRVEEALSAQGFKG